MDVRLLAVDDIEWSRFLAQTDHDFYHLPSYAAVCARQEDATPGAVYVSDHRRAMLLPVLVRRIPGGGLDAISPYGYAGPLIRGVRSQGFLSESLMNASSHLRSRGIVSLFVRLHPILNDPPPDGPWAVVHQGQTVVVDLSLPPERIWKETRKGHRSDIMRAEAAGYRARFDDSQQRFDSFKRMYWDTMARVSAAPYYFFDDAYFETLRAALAERLRLCVVEADGALLAAGLFVETGGFVQYHLSASGSDRLTHGVVKLMIDYVRRWAANRGDAWLHLGGGVGAADDSLFRFKAGFSPLRRQYRTLRIVTDEPEYARLVGERDPVLDPRDLGGFFPRYRDKAAGQQGNAPQSG